MSRKIRKIPLTRNYVALVDAEKYEQVSGHKWCAQCQKFSTGRKTVYAVTTIAGKKVTMHRLILRPGPGLEVDHIDGDGLNNTCANLRLATRAQNSYNRQKTAKPTLSRFKGVTKRNLSRNRPWEAYVTKTNSIVHLGHFADEIAAARAYDKKAKELFGEFARLNFADQLEDEGFKKNILRTRGRIFSVEFVSRTTGRIRTMLCRTGVKRGVKGKGQAFTPAKKHLVSVFDVVKGAWRFVPLETIRLLKTGGKLYCRRPVAERMLF